jgi:hypothetical protein
MQVATRKKINPMKVKNIEEIIFLLQEWEKDYRKNWWVDVKIAYKRGLEYINNLKI